jgi:CBS domain containing-hemolysin-like protein
MPDTDAPSRPESTETAGDIRNLPVPVTEGEPREPGERWFVRVLRTLFGWKSGSMRADLQVVLEAGTPGETGFSPEESTMLKNILGLRERRVEDVMVPRADIVAVQEDISLGELVKVFEKAAHSRLVVYKETLDDPTGMVHIRDLIAFMTAHATVAPSPTGRRRKQLTSGLDFRKIELATPLAATRIVRTALFVPPSMPAMDLLAKMQATRIHLALVIDEYGGTDGLVSIEDIVELIVGDIEDEHDEVGEHPIIRQSDGSYLADARASLEDVVAMVGHEFDPSEVSDEVDTLGGFIVAQVGRLPVRGELVPGPGPFEIEVLDADPRRVKRVRIHRSRRKCEAPALAARRDGEAEPARRTAAAAAVSAEGASTEPPREPAAVAGAETEPSSAPTGPEAPSAEPSAAEPSAADSAASPPDQAISGDAHRP